MAGFSVASLVLFSIFVSCVQVDDSVGNEFIPSDQYMSMAVDSSFIIKTYNITTDSIESSSFSVNYAGSAKFPQTGAINAGFVFQMTPLFFNEAYDYYGKDAVIDSLFFIFSITDSIGKPNVPQTFHLYELTEPVYHDSIYYADFDATPIMKSTPLLSFQNTDWGYSGDLSIKFEDQNFINTLLDTTYYYDYRLLRDNRFRGFCIVPDDPDLDASVYSFDLAGSYIMASYHNKNEQPDTTFAYYLFAPAASSSSGGVSQSVSMLTYDYTDADPALRIDDKSVPVERTYIHGFGGLATMLDFDNGSVAEIKRKVAAAGYSDIVINKAKLEISYPERDLTILDKAFDRLGMYTDFRTYEPIVDYDYESESYYYYSIPYGGYINRSVHKYQMDITQYVQRLFRDDYDERQIILAPSVGEINSFNYVGLDGYGSADPVRLVITYTMTK